MRTIKTAAFMLVLLLFLGQISCEKKEPPATVGGEFKPTAGKDYIYVGVNNAMHVIDGETDTIIKTISHPDYIIGGAFSPDGSRYYANAFHSIHVFDTAKQELVDTYRLSSKLSTVNVAGFAATPDNKILYISCGIVKKKQNVPRLNVLPPQLIVYDTEKKQIIRNYEVPYMIKSVLTLRNDPDHLILIGYDVYKFSLKTGKIETIATIFNPKGDDKKRNCLPGMDAMSPGDHGILVYGYFEGEGLELGSGYMIIDRNDGSVQMIAGSDLWLSYSAMLSPDKKYIYAVMDELIKIDAETGETVQFVPVEVGTVYGVTTSADGRKIYVGPGGPDVSVYDAETLKLLKVIPLDGDGGFALGRVTL